MSPTPPAARIVDGESRILWPGDVWDRWYDASRLPVDLKRKLSVHDLKTLAYHASDAFLPEYRKAMTVLGRLTAMARTSGGTAGPDEDLMQACADAEALLQSYVGLKPEREP